MVSTCISGLGILTYVGRLQNIVAWEIRKVATQSSQQIYKSPDVFLVEKFV